MKSLDPRQLFRIAGASALLLALGACATLAEPAVVPDYDGSMAVAHGHIEAGHAREAVVALKQAAAIQPTRKEPWLQIARLRAGQGRHVDALAATEQVLRRDPADQVASGISISSGLQVALQTMKRLRAAGEAPSEASAEQARTIALLMTEVFGPELLIPEEIKARLAQEAVDTYKASRTERLPEAQKKPKGDPLDLLGGD